ncbi:hypothetical protein AAY473_002663 [Plecturocebus cupreus]
MKPSLPAPPFLQALPITNLLPVSVDLPVPDSYMNGTIQYEETIPWTEGSPDLFGIEKRHSDLQPDVALPTTDLVPGVLGIFTHLIPRLPYEHLKTRSFWNLVKLGLWPEQWSSEQSMSSRERKMLALSKEGLCIKQVPHQASPETRKNFQSGRVWWLTPVIPDFGRMRWADHLRSGVQDQPGQHGKNSVFIKNVKISQAWWYAPVIPGTQKAEA